MGRNRWPPRIGALPRPVPAAHVLGDLSGRDRNARGGRAGNRIQSRYPPDPVGKLLRLPRPRRPQARGGLAARSACRGDVDVGFRQNRHRGRQARGQRARAPDHDQRRRRADAARRLKQTTFARADRGLAALGGRRRPVRGALVVPAARPASSACRHRDQKPARPLHSRRVVRAGTGCIAAGRPGLAGPARGLRPDRIASHARAGRPVRGQSERRGLRAVGRRAVGFAPLWRADGHVVAGPGALCRQRGLSRRSTG